MTIEIRHRYTNAVLFCFTPKDGKAESISMAVRAALKAGADLRGADLRNADLYGADLRSANLCGANLRHTDLRSADLCGANLRNANLYGANLCGANLYGANLYGANLRSADLYGADLRSADLCNANLCSANLRNANLCGANLRGANLRNANLYGANLCGVKGADLAIAQTRILPEGSIIGWKKCRNDVIVKLRIPEEAKRSHAFGRKCRAEYADVLEIFGAEEAISKHDNTVAYRVGERVTCHEWDGNWQEECAGGIHFFITRIEAENY